MKPRKNSTSKYRGVSWNKQRSKWASHITYNRKQINLGNFDCEEEAALAYNYKASELGFNKEAFNKVFE